MLLLPLHTSGAGTAGGAGPIVSDLNGVQAEPGWRVVTGVAVNF